ncbi:MAG TPA: S9 family peptidase [Streptosporangiaceae bacterium]|nr:S9 family peptidase [Streptosporangiaceae bacterium]
MTETASAPAFMVAEDIARLRQLADPQVSPTGSAVAFTVSDPDVESNNYRRQIWLTPADSADGQPYPFTGQGHEVLPRWSPDGRRLAFVSAPPGNGPQEICILPVAAGGERVVVCSWHSPVTELAWSPDGSRLAFVARDPAVEQYGQPGQPQEGKDMPPRRVTRLIYRLNAAGWTLDRPSRVFVVAADGSSAPRTVTPGPFQADGLAWSPDSSKIAFASARHDTWDLDLANDLWIAEVDGTAEPARLTDGGSVYARPSWSPDGRRLAYYFNRTPLENPRHRQVGVLDLSSRQQQVLTASLDRNCQLLGLLVSPCWIGDHLLFAAEDSGNVHLYQAKADGTEKPQIIVGGDRWVSEWSWAAGTLAFVAATPASTGELLVKGLSEDNAGNGESEERALTRLTQPFAESVSLGSPQRFIARSGDGSEVECWAIPPAGARPGEKYPTLLNVHGGPFTQYGNRFMDEFQLEAAAGFGVLYSNPRGSSGYSEQWGRAVRWPECESDPGTGWGSVDFEDVMACVDTACERFDWIDPDRLGILGGSYGGYMTSWAVGHTDRFKAACSERACNNLTTMEHSADISGFLRSYVGRDHLTDPEAYARHSPVTYVKDMTTPLLILHSEDDLRCPIAQAEELFVALRLLGREPVMVRFPAENHELSRGGSPGHRIMRANLILDWFRERL